MLKAMTSEGDDNGKMATMAEDRMFQATPVNDENGRRPRWSDEEDKTLCDILKTQWKLEKDSSGKLNGTKFWPLVSAKFKECGFDRTTEQCRSYWYGTIRIRPAFKDTLQFRAFNDRHSMPLAMASKAGTDMASGSSKIETPRTLSSSVVGDSVTIATTEAGGTPRHLAKSMLVGGSPSSSSVSQTAKDNGSMFRWKDHETQKLRETVLAKRSSTIEDNKELGVPFWSSISQELANNGINRTWQACARRFQRTNSGPHVAEQGLQSDHLAGPMPGKLYHPNPDNDDTEDDDGSRLDLDDGDTPYGDDGEPRRGTRKRVSKPAWSDEEHNRLVQLMKARRKLESEDESLEKLSNNKLFGLVSKQLKHYLIDRSAGACNLYWTHKGSARSDFNIDPRVPYSDGISKNVSSGEGEELYPVAKDIEDAYDRLPQQDFDDSPFVQSFLKGHIEHLKAAEKRPRGSWYTDDEESDVPTENSKRRRTAGDALGNKENESLGPGMVKRRAPKRDPSLPLLKNNTGMASGQYIVPGSIGTSEGSKYDAEYPMKMKIRDLEDEISALETSKQKAVSDIRDDESEMVSIHNKIELLQVQKQKIQQSRREKEGQLDVYSTRIEKLNSQKKHLEVALDIVRGST